MYRSTLIHSNAESAVSSCPALLSRKALELWASKEKWQEDKDSNLMEMDREVEAEDLVVAVAALEAVEDSVVDKEEDLEIEEEVEISEEGDE